MLGWKGRAAQSGVEVTSWGGTPAPPGQQGTSCGLKQGFLAQGRGNKNDNPPPTKRRERQLVKKHGLSGRHPGMACSSFL